jgi:hypothetical protein
MLCRADAIGLFQVESCTQLNFPPRMKPRKFYDLVSEVAGIGRAARAGILIKGGEHLENAGRITALALDKTGTLTEGQPRLAEIVALNGQSEADVLLWAGIAETGSNHPLGRPIIEAARKQGPLPTAESLEEIAGMGLIARHDGHDIAVGSHRLFDHLKIAFNTEAKDGIARLHGLGHNAMRLLRVPTATPPRSLNTGAPCWKAARRPTLAGESDRPAHRTRLRRSDHNRPARKRKAGWLMQHIRFWAVDRNCSIGYAPRSNRITECDSWRVCPKAPACSCMIAWDGLARVPVHASETASSMPEMSLQPRSRRPAAPCPL